MMFLNGLLAGFAVLGSVPIIIHLLNRSRFRIVEWGAMEFILRTLQKNSRRLQLRDLILMLLRTLAIVLAALALARPTIADGGFSVFGAGGGVNAVIVLDDGLSMQARDTNETRFQLAVQAARDILKGLPRGSSAALVLASDIADAEVAEPTQDLAYLEQLLDKAQAGEGGSNIEAGLKQAWDILEPLGGSGEIYLIGDLQARGWPDAAERGWRDLVGAMQASSALRVYVTDVGADGTGNVSVERIAFTDEIVATESVATVVATLRNHGGEIANGIPVDLLVDDGTGLRSAATAVVDQVDRTAQVRLEARFDRGGLHKIEVRSGPDRLDADNVRRAVVDVVDRIKVLIVDGSEVAEDSGLPFLRAALAPASLLDQTGIEDEQRDRIELTVTTPAQLVGLRLDDYQTVILADVPEPTESLAEGLRSYVAGGRGLITLLGRGANPQVYDQVFLPRGLLPGALETEPRRYADPDDLADPGTTFSTDNLVHPIVAFFADKETQPFLAQPRVKAAWALTVPEAESGHVSPHSVVLRLADGVPVATASRVGRGLQVVFGLSCDKVWSDLPLRPAFLMLLRRTVQLSVLGDRPRLNVEIHEPVVQPISAREAAEKASVRFPPGEERGIAAITREDGASRLEFADTVRAGFVDFVTGEQVRSFAVNAQADESDLTRHAREAIEERMSPLRVTWITAGEDIAARLEEGRFGKEIWPILLVLAITCLLAESFLALRWGPKAS